MKAIIKTGGKQYYVEENSRIYVEKLDVEAGQKVVFDEVLFVDGKAGKPFVKGASVEAEVIKNGSVSLEYSFDSVEEAIKQLGEGFEKALETGGATITDDGNGHFIATVDATISSEVGVVGEQGAAETDEDTSTTKEDTAKKDVTDKFQDLND